MLRVLLSLAALLLAALTAGSELPAEAGGDEPSHFSGVVLAVEASRGLLTVEEASLDGPQQHFVVTEDADITKDEKRIDLHDIEIGDPVSIGYETTSKGNEARSVTVITAPAT